MTTAGSDTRETRSGRILLLARSFPPPDGGVERRYANLCRSFPPGSIEVCTSGRDGQAKFDHEQPYPIHRLGVPPLREKNPLGFARWTAWALARVARGGVGIVWVGDLRPIGRIGWVVHELSRLPYGISFYGWDLSSLLQPRRWQQGWKKWLGRAVFDGASFFLANSEHIAGLAREYTARVGARSLEPRLHVIRSGADLGRFRADRDPGRCRAELGLDGGPILLTAARLIPQKGLVTALRAFALIAQAHPDLTYAIAGRGDQEGELRALARELGIEGRVRFLGAVPYERMPVLHGAADIFLLTSRSRPHWSENFPNACLEAMASGKPVVAGRIGGVPEMVADGETGFLVDPEEPQMIAAALGRVLEDRSLRERMGRAGRARVEREFVHGDVARKIYGVMARASRLPLPPWSGADEGVRPGGQSPEAAFQV